MNKAMVDPRLVLGPDELAAARANVAAAPPLSAAQVDLISDLFRPIVRQLLVQYDRTVRHP
ncbi:hypothetical protein NLX83_13675 [Allokutzneria sp. A3M-2-11 16]|uniref:hypothetical protein n=1 Tax=Allokutzneria sp. A3M-2-11 16 TaxID=2962043 RepID=UPI0020B7F4DC|nr:hypothetical protein [Allokutzneria sp. A3M-2-11 16]MCP3800308.1 hypothetical protein [Allokutzneria sp. A3M-2-11 16]